MIGDEVRLKQVLINLIKNALKFTEKGSVKVHAAFVEEDSLLKVRVIDTGTGITKEDQTKLFK